MIGILFSTLLGSSPLPSGAVLAQQSSPTVLSPAAVAAQIDRTLIQHADNLGLQREARIDDATFLRRVMLDLCGTLPTRALAESFVEDDAPDRFAQLVRSRLESDECAEHWARQWEELLLSGAQNRRGTSELMPWLENAFLSRTPFDEVVKALIAGNGQSGQDGNLGFLVAYRDDREALASVTARSFLGLQIQCAQCHDSKDGDWTQSDFEGFASFFTTMRFQTVDRESAGELAYEVKDLDRAQARREALRKLADLLRRNEADPQGPVMMETEVASSGEDPAAEKSARERMRKNPRTSGRRLRSSLEQGLDEAAFERLLAPLPAEIQERARTAREREERFSNPRFLDGTELADSQLSQRAALAAWTVEPTNPWFSRAIVNRLWSELFGYGLVDPVDDLGNGTEKVPGLLDFLADQFERSGYSVHWLIECLARTETYALGASDLLGDARIEAERQFAAHPVRPLSPEQILNALVTATQFDRRARRRGADDGASAERRMLQQFKVVFADDEGGEVSSFAAGIPEALFLMNGRLTNDAITLRASPVLREIMADHERTADRLEALFLATLGRRPSEAERRKLGSGLKDRGKSSSEQWNDIYWALLNCSEFRTNH